MFDLMPWSKKDGSALLGFKDEFDNLFKRFFGNEFLSSHGIFKEGKFVPRVDVKEGKKEIIVQAEIPGCDAKDIDVSLNGRMLVIKGEKKEEKEEKEENVHRIERSFGSFSRMIELPVEVDQDNIDAVYKEGVLKLEFKKTKETEGRKIEIKIG